jgi:hypothetical protein
VKSFYKCESTYNTARIKRPGQDSMRKNGAAINAAIKQWLGSLSDRKLASQIHAAKIATPPTPKAHRVINLPTSTGYV